VATFGEIFIRLLEIEAEFNILHRRLDLVNAVPDCSIEEIKQLELEKRQDELHKLLEDKMEIEMLMTIGEPIGIPIDGDELTNYKEECKKLIKKIWYLTHPDHFINTNFTEAQYERLNIYFRQTTEINNENYYDKIMKVRRQNIGFGFVQLQTLQDILAKVKAIYKNMGVDIPEDAQIEGETLQEQIDWLEEQIVKLEKELTLIKNQSHVLSVDKDIQRKQSSIGSEENIKLVKKDLEEQINNYQQKIEKLKKVLEKRFGTEGGLC